MMVSEDIHKWTDGRYTLMFDEHTFFVWDNEEENRMTALQVTKKLNEQQSKIKELEEEKIELGKKLECCEYGHFINELDKIHAKIDKGDYSDFKTLKQEEKDKQIEEDYARLQRRKILERSGNCEPLTLKYNPNTTYLG